jgi:hypothetical protein
VRLLCDGRGQYKGHIIGKTLSGLDREMIIAANRDDWFGKLRAVAALTGQRLAGTGYTGPFGIDAFAHRSNLPPGEIVFRPLVEVNARFTMGRIALELERCMPHGKTGLWRHFSRNEIKRFGYGSFVTFVTALEKVSQSQVIPTNDPHTTQLLMSVLIIGSNLAECENAINAASQCNDANLKD